MAKEEFKNIPGSELSPDFRQIHDFFPDIIKVVDRQGDQFPPFLITNQEIELRGSRSFFIFMSPAGYFGEARGLGFNIYEFREIDPNGQPVETGGLPTFDAEDLGVLHHYLQTMARTPDQVVKIDLGLGSHSNWKASLLPSDDKSLQTELVRSLETTNDDFRKIRMNAQQTATNFMSILKSLPFAEATTPQIPK